MHTAIKKLTEADAALRQALNEIGAREVEPDVHRHMAAARKSVDRARAILERRQRLRLHKVLAGAGGAR